MNVADLVRASADAHLARPALVFHGREITYAELDDRTDLTAATLAGLGVRRGDRVALLAGNVPEFVSSFYGIARAGAGVCPLNIQLTGEEIGYVLADAGVRAAIVELPALPALLAVRDRLADLETILVIGGPPAPRGTLSLEEALRTAGEPPGAQSEADDLALLAYTSGTTAAPKGAILTHGNLMANLDQIASVPILAPTAADVVLLVLPLFHSYALSALGLTMRAAALPAEVFEAFRDRFGVTVWEGYGLTEAAPAVTANAVGGEAKAASVGPPLPGIEVRLIDEDGDDAEEDDPGELLVRGPNVFAGYWNRPEATAEVLRGGWLHTGDVAVRDEDGYLFLVDRKKDLIVVSGFNVYPREVEEAIERHQDVVEAGVVGIPDERTGEAIQAWIVPTPGARLTQEQILEFLDGYLARFKWPKEVHVVEELPHHVTGKVLRRVLRGEEVLAEVEQRPGEAELEGEEVLGRGELASDQDPGQNEAGE